MSLRKQIVILFVPLILLMNITIYLQSRKVLTDSFAQIENNKVYDQINRVQNALSSEIETLTKTVKDWAAFDDTYSYIQGNNPEYIAKNIDETIFSNFNLAFIVLSDSTKKTMYAQSYNKDENKLNDIPSDVLGKIESIIAQHSFDADDKLLMGFISVANTNYIVAIKPISNTKQDAPVKGCLIMGRLIDHTLIHQLSVVTQCLLQYDYWNSSSSSKLSPNIKKNELLKEKRLVLPISNDLIAGYLTMSDIDENTIGIIRIDLPRPFLVEANRVIYYISSILTIIGILFTVVIIILVDKRIIQRLAKLNHDIQLIDESKDLSLRVEQTGKDEVTNLATAMNNMLCSLEDSKSIIAASQARLSAVVEQAADAIVTINKSSCIESYNKAAEVIFGYSADEIIGQPISLLMPEPYRSKHASFINEYLETGNARIIGMGREVLGQRKNGTIFPLYLAVSEVKTSTQHLFTGIMRDITEHKRIEEQLQRAASYDTLTGLMNRRFFEEQLDVALNAAKRYGHALCMVMGDIDKFKLVNDTYGHKAGDMVLEKFGEIVREQIRVEDLAGRFGGDEFCFCFTHSPSVISIHAVERIRIRLAEHVFKYENGEEFHATATFGLADIVNANMTKEALFDLADRALYLAKKQGRNQSLINQA